MLYKRIDARPLRQPFFSFAADDELVAAYLGYDDVVDLNKFRLQISIIMFPDYPGLLLLCDEEQAKVLAILHEIEWFSCYNRKTPNFIHEVKEMRANDALSSAGFKYANLILDTAGKLSKPQTYETAWYDADEFDSFYRRRGGFLFPLERTGGLPALKRPIDIECDHDKSIEGCLRSAFLLESAKVMKKPSVWARMFRGCVDDSSKLFWPK